jgi:hypothetical protein
MQQPSRNSNKTIAKYLAGFCHDSTLDRELYLAPLMFSYNTSFHCLVKTLPLFLDLQDGDMTSVPTNTRPMPKILWEIYH